MRVLFVSYAEKTHFIGMVPLAWAMRAAGHEVRVASQPELADFVAGAGLPFTPVGRNHRLRALSDWALGQGIEQGSGLFDVGDNWPEEIPWREFKLGVEESVEWWWKVINDPMTDDLVDFCREWRPSLVVWETTTYSAAVAAEACGASHTRFVWSLDLLSRMREQYLRAMAEQPADDQEDPLREWLSARAGRHGVDFSETLVRGHATIDHLPASLGFAPGCGVRKLPVRYEAYNGRAEVLPWLRTPPERPRICIGMGTSAHEWYGRYAVSVSDLLDGLADMDVEVVATLPGVQHGDGTTSVPDNVRLVEFAPLHVLLPGCSAIINHGGPSTVCSSFAAGVPQLCYAVPDLDAPMLARKVEEAGAGIAVDSATATVDTMARALRRVLDDPGFGRAAAGIRDEMLAMPNPSDLVATLEGIAAERKGVAAAV